MDGGADRPVLAVQGLPRAAANRIRNVDDRFRPRCFDARPRRLDPLRSLRASESRQWRDDEYQCPAGERAIHRFNRVEGGLMIRTYWSSACPGCAIKAQCTTSAYRRIRRWEHEAVLEQMQRRLDRKPEAMTLRRSTVEHVFGTLKHWMGTTHFLTRRLEHVGTEMSLHVLAYNLKRVMQVLGIAKTMKAMSLVGA